MNKSVARRLAQEIAQVFGLDVTAPPLLIPSGKYCFVGELFVEYVVKFLHPSSRILYGK